MWYGTEFYRLSRLVLLSDSPGECSFIEAKKKGVSFTLSWFLKNEERADLPFIVEQKRFSMFMQAISFR
jgi:hypothetical protein